ncbi:hypothetical protein A5893_16880 [Pedobacter psychrophilus]|uniref:BT-3987-like N-terminal domain-containing protein n=2 Tax=Pedobacter psychrophilus TaxID=1826909 RepID=A0A179DA04_9SPHI|nr:hypothetical protein A5893_16880 [Pedobacter psychrophilus]
MKIFRNISLIVLTVFILASCKKYDSYVSDFDFSVVYFASQKPLRTIVAYDNMSFKVGVTLGGVRNNKSDQTVKYEIDPSLLTSVSGAGVFKLLPANYYTISDNSTMVVKEGQLIGDVTLTLNKALFTADPDALQKAYALPLRIVSTTTDSILRGSSNVPAKDYTILVVKYISPYHGTYYHKGKETKLSDNSVTVYSKKDLSQNATFAMLTNSLNSIKTPGAGTSSGVPLNLAINNTSVAISGNVANEVSGSGTYDPQNKSFYLNYNYKNGTNKYSVIDTLILRQAPELDLRFEEW